LWKLKAPLKIQGVILTKNNLARWNWQGRKQCCFFTKMRQLSIYFLIVVSHAASGLSHPRSMSHMFGTWLWGFRKDLNSLFLLGATATCWSL
jgi:hypothetical protein